MLTSGAHTLPKEERLSGKTAVSSLISSGRWGMQGPVKFCYVRHAEGGLNRIMVSVPKKHFKRAVKRNLLKRRLREAYRLQKGLLTAGGIDLMLFYNSQEIASTEELAGTVALILKEIDKRTACVDN